MHIIDLSLTDFLDTYRYQIDLVDKVSKGIVEDTLLITEHKPIITIGRSGSCKDIYKSREDLSSSGIEVLEVDRGGGVTYHGHGQLIAYPIFKLRYESKAIHSFLYFLEDIGIHFLAQYGLKGQRRSGFRGVWIEGSKIGSIGIGIKKWVTYHGLSLNINIDLTPFSFIRPCGIERVQMTSLEKLLKFEININDAKSKLIKSFREISFLAETVSKN